VENLIWRNMSNYYAHRDFIVLEANHGDLVLDGF